MSADRSGQVLLAAAAGGSQAAQRALFTAHFDGLYAFFRMALGEATEAEQAAVDTLALAVEHHHEAAVPAGQLHRWLIDLAVARVQWAAVPAPAAARSRHRVAPLSAQILRGVPDRALTALIRSLEPGPRQAVVLMLTAGLDAERAGAVLGVTAEQACALRDEGLSAIAGRLQRYQTETEIIGRTAREAAYHLRPRRGPMSDGIITIRGTRAHVAPGPGNGFMYMALRALERLFHRVLGHEVIDEMDEVGGSGKMPERPKTTPGQQAFKKPKLTPSLTEYDMPKATPGMGGFRQPRSTPSTSRLSNPTRMPGTASTTYGSRRYGR